MPTRIQCCSALRRCLFPCGAAVLVLFVLHRAWSTVGVEGGSAADGLLLSVTPSSVADLVLGDASSTSTAPVATTPAARDANALDAEPLWRPSRPTEYPPVALPKHASCRRLPEESPPRQALHLGVPLGEIRCHRRPRVGASIAVHPPKFYAAAMFLEQYVKCPAAVDAMSVFLVFTNKREMNLFRQAVACLAPSVPPEAWYNVVVMKPAAGWGAYDNNNQRIAAYKKWHGLAYMMDLGEDAPDYGLMLDSELLLFDGLGNGKTGERHCGRDGHWSQLYSRIQAQEAAKAFPAAAVSATHTTYNFGKYTRSGRDYDQVLMKSNADFVSRGTYSKCAKPQCEELRRQIREVLWSWWTDLPWTNLTVVGDMLTMLSRKPAAEGRSWRNVSAHISFVPFEHIGYQQWCTLHEGFTLRDVTSLTGLAKWGSYNEDPMPGCQFAPLSPMWISGYALEAVEKKVVLALNDSFPPLLIFHVDKGKSRDGRDKARQTYATVLSDLNAACNCTEWDRKRIMA